MERINQYTPNLTNGDDGFTVLAFTEEMAIKEILTIVDAEDFDGIDLVGTWAVNHWETESKLEFQTYW